MTGDEESMSYFDTLQRGTYHKCTSCAEDIRCPWCETSYAYCCPWVNGEGTDDICDDCMRALNILTGQAAREAAKQPVVRVPEAPKVSFSPRPKKQKAQHPFGD